MPVGGDLLYNYFGNLLPRPLDILFQLPAYSDLCAQHDGPHVPAQQQVHGESSGYPRALIWVKKAASQQIYRLLTPC